MAKPCKHFGCPNLVSSKAERGYCDDHASERTNSNWEKRKDAAGSTTARGYGAPWKKLRLIILARDKYLCQECLRNSRYTRANHVDHILNKAAGGTDDHSNLQALCEPCHNAKTARETH